MTKLSTDDRFADTTPNQTKKFRNIVQKARNKQQIRFEGTTIPFNAAIPGGAVREYCNFSEDGFEHYKTVVGLHSISTRSMDRLAKVARTVADINDSDTVEIAHVDRAASFVIGGILRDAMK